MSEQQQCRSCGVLFTLLDWERERKETECKDCRNRRQREWKAERKKSGRPVVTKKMPRDWHRQYEATYRERPEVRKALNERAAQRRLDGAEKKKATARRRLRHAIETGTIKRGDCRDCGSPNTQGHHSDYSRPIDVIWLCPIHHAAEHRKAEPKS